MHSQREQRYRCIVCCRIFAASTGTPLYRLHHDRQPYLWTITLLAYGCPTMAIVHAFGLDERTVRHWHQQVQQTLVETPRDQGQVQVDERHIKTHGGVVWVACAVASRLWLGAAVQPRRSHLLAVRVLMVLRRPDDLLAGGRWVVPVCACCPPGVSAGPAPSWGQWALSLAAMA